MTIRCACSLARKCIKRLLPDILVSLQSPRSLRPNEFFKALDHGSAVPVYLPQGSPSTDVVKKPLRYELQQPGPRWLGNFRSNVAVSRKYNDVHYMDTAIYNRRTWPPFAAGTCHVMNRAFVKWLAKHAQELESQHSPSSGVWMEVRSSSLSSSLSTTSNPMC